MAKPRTPKLIRTLSYYKIDNWVRGIPLVPWKKMRKILGDRWVDQFKAWMKKKKKRFYPEGGSLYHVADYLEWKERKRYGSDH